MIKEIKRILFCGIAVLSTTFYHSQSNDSIMLRKIFDQALTNGQCHENLRELCKDIGHRLTASPASYEAIDWGKKKLEEMKLDSVWLQPVTVPHWVRGNIERLDFSSKEKPLHISHCTALGGSVGTEGKVVEAEVIEVKDWEELAALSDKDVKGKVVFYNRPLNPALISTFSAYGGCSGYRFYGADKASAKGAVGIVLRSLTLRDDLNPHTGSMGYNDSVERIPGMAISSKDSYVLSNMLKMDPKTKLKFKLDCQTLPDTISYNVIGEIKRSENPDEILLVGGHLDSWDIGEGAHDDGAGVVQSIEVMRMITALHYQPKRTIRCVLYMNEENGNMGGKGYAKYAEEYQENHVLALETDRGGFSPRGFSIQGTEDQVTQIKNFESLFEPYYIHLFQKGYGGVDIGPLKNGKVCLVGLIPDSQRYFDFHHAPSDVWENVNKRELEMGSGAILGLIYLADNYFK